MKDIGSNVKSYRYAMDVQQSSNINMIRKCTDMLINNANKFIFRIKRYVNVVKYSRLYDENEPY